jgi:predicted AlkP superfamily pyrophosphatase or phosphodiesterase
MRRLVILNVVGLTPRLIRLAPRLSTLTARSMQGVFPAVTMSAQASMLTGMWPSEHGVVGNTWFWRELGEVRNWVQSNRLLHGGPLYRGVSTAKMFWWFNQGSGCEFSVTPKPHYGSDGSKEFDIQSEPPGLAAELKAKLGDFPFHAFWGPMAGPASSDWIARATAHLLREKQPTLTLCYLPHLDYDLQRFGDKADIARLVKEVDACAALVLDAADVAGARVLVVSEYGIAPVSGPVYLNRELRKAGLLRVRGGPYGEMLDVHDSRAFAVCDHQVAHIYVRNRDEVNAVADMMKPHAGKVLVGDAKRELHIDHANAGEIVALSATDAWFAYPYWLDDANAPDFARSVDIHRKPGYDPCELFLDGSRAGMGATLLRKKLGLRYRFKSCPLDASMVKGSHGLPPATPDDGPVIACSEASLLPDAPTMLDVKPLTLRMMGL